MNLIKQLLPPLLWDLIYRSPLKKYGWFGRYDTWEEAQKASKGYDTDLILRKVMEASLRVKRGEFPYERDSKLFDHVEYDWPLLGGLLWIAARNGGRLRVIDFGGSLGSTYRQNRKFFEDLDVHWNIVEQPKFVEAGREKLADNRLKFYDDVPSCLKEQDVDVLLLSSVLSYIKQPYELLSSLIDTKIQYFIIDRILLIDGDEDRLTVQVVAPDIYDASYPTWFFSEQKFMKFIATHFEIIESFDCGLKLNIKSEVKGLILKLKVY